MKFSVIILVLVVIGLAVTGCSTAAGPPEKTQLPATTPVSPETPVPSTTTPFISTRPVSENLPDLPGIISDSEAQRFALAYLENSATFQFDGVPGSIRFIKSGPGFSSAYRSTMDTFEYQTRHPGHGDRSGQMLAQVIAGHSINILVNIDEGKVAWAVCDSTWDAFNEKVLPVYLSGFVVGGSDTASSGGPLDTPHKFVYQIRKDDGTQVNVSYTAYPPSPVGNAQKNKITLDFYAGSIKTGDRLEACGTLDQASNTVIVAEQGNYIRTSVPKAEVVGRIISGSDTSGADGPRDAPRRFVYQIQKNDGTLVDVVYTAYPPSPSGDAARAKITFSLYADSIQVGDYLKAYGTLDTESGTVTLTDDGDFLKTYPLDPLP